MNLLFVAMLTMVAGLIAAWKWERIGGLLILGGLAFFAVVNHGIRFNVVFGPMLTVYRHIKKCSSPGQNEDGNPAVG